jgi:hypothetical protein
MVIRILLSVMPNLAAMRFFKCSGVSVMLPYRVQTKCSIIMMRNAVVPSVDVRLLLCLVEETHSKTQKRNALATYLITPNERHLFKAI